MYIVNALEDIYNMPVAMITNNWRIRYKNMYFGVRVWLCVFLQYNGMPVIKDKLLRTIISRLRNIGLR